MSWVFGVYSKRSSLLKNDYGNMHDKPLKIYRDKKYYIAVGGLSENVMIGEISKSAKWVMCGRGIIRKNNQFSFMGKTDWENFYYSKLSRDELNGHFVFIKWDDEKITIENDMMGLRDLFYYQNNDLLIFSTRLDVILKFGYKFELNLKNFSGYVHFDAPFHNETFIKGIHRLGSNGKIVWNSKELIVQKSYWKPQKVKYPSIIKLLDELTVFSINQGKHISLALSGGIDSRTLLAFLLQHKRDDFEVHTWGDENNLDVQIAKKIAKKFNLNIQIIKPLLPEGNELIERYQEFIKETTLYYPASYLFDLTFEYKKYFKDNMIVIDGANGELLRRFTFTKLYWFGKKHILKNNVEGLHKILFRNKIDVFKPEIKRKLLKNSKVLLNEFLKTMPDPHKIGVHNWIDLLMIRTYLCNKSTANQGRIDSVSANYMPFVQPDLLNMIFLYPQMLRTKSQINKQIFRKYAPKLTKIPIVKDEAIIPFDMNFISSNIKSRLKKRFFPAAQNTFKYYLLDEMKDYIFDTFNSVDALNYELYDNVKIKKAINGYFSGEKNNANTLIWLLSFDVWRKLL